MHNLSKKYIAGLWQAGHGERRGPVVGRRASRFLRGAGLCAWGGGGGREFGLPAGRGILCRTTSLRTCGTLPPHCELVSLVCMVTHEASVKRAGWL